MTAVRVRYWSPSVEEARVRVERRELRTGCPLSVREMEVLGWFASGRVASAKHVAARLGCSEKTVQNHVVAAARSLGTSGKLQTVIVAMQRGWVTWPPVAEAA